MHYNNSMPSAFDNITYLSKMWDGVLVISLFHDLSDLANSPTTWKERSATLWLTIELYYGIDAGADVFFLYSHRDELKNPAIYDSSDDIRSVPSSHVLTPRSGNLISYSCGIKITPFYTSNNQHYFVSLFRNHLKKSRILLRITFCLSCHWSAQNTPSWSIVAHPSYALNGCIDGG